MKAVHLYPISPKPGEQRPLFEGYRMRGISGGCLLGMLQSYPGAGGKILYKSAPQGYVEHLDSLADSQKRHLSFQGLPSEGNLKSVEKGKGFFQSAFRLFSPEERMHVASAGKEHPIHSLKLFLHAFKMPQLREYQGNSAGFLHGFDIGVGEIASNLPFGRAGFISPDSDKYWSCHDTFPRLFP
jgi:hypothetical protein